MVKFNGAPHRVHIQVTPSSEEEEEVARARNAVVMFLEGEAVEHNAGADRKPTKRR